MTSATTNTHQKVRRRPRLRVSECEPYVWMNVLLTACSVRVLVELCSLAEGGMTLPCAPVSMRKCIPESRSMMKNRRLGLGPVMSAAFTYWPSHFPNRSREVNIFGLCHQNGRGISTRWDVEVVSVVETDGEEKLCSLAEGGMTLTCAPVSMRKRIPESRSMMKNRWLGLGPGMSAAFTYWPSRFPNRSREVNIFGLCHKMGVVSAHAGMWRW